MRSVLLVAALLLGVSECVESAGPLSPSDRWRIRMGWPARDGTERERWAANGYGPNGEKLSEPSRGGALRSPALIPAPRPSPPPAQPQQTAVTRPTPHPSSLAAIQKEFSYFVEHGSLPKPHAEEAAKTRTGFVQIPDQPYVEGMDASSKRLELFERGLLPLTRIEARHLLSGGQPTYGSSATVREAYQAARFLLGQVTADELPSAYRYLLRRAALRGAAATGTAPPVVARQPAMPQSVFVGWDANGQPITGTHTGGGNYFMGWDERGQPINRQATDMGGGGIFLGFDENGQPITGR